MRKRHGDINRKKRSNVEVQGEKGIIIKGAEEGRGRDGGKVYAETKNR